MRSPLPPLTSGITGTSRSRSPSRYQSRGGRAAPVAPSSPGARRRAATRRCRARAAVAETATRSTGSVRRMPYCRACSSWKRATARPEPGQTSSPAGSATSTACGWLRYFRATATRSSTAARPRRRGRRRRAARPPRRPPRARAGSVSVDRREQALRRLVANLRQRRTERREDARRRRHVGRAGMPSSRARSTAKAPPAPPNANSEHARGSKPRFCRHLADQHRHLVQRHAGHGGGRVVRVVVGGKARCAAPSRPRRDRVGSRRRAGPAARFRARRARR